VVSSPLHLSLGRGSRGGDEDYGTGYPCPDDEEALRSSATTGAALAAGPGSPQTILSEVEESIFAPDSDLLEGDESDEEDTEEPPADIVG
jgi:hypothetical protein